MSIKDDSQYVIRQETICILTGNRKLITSRKGDTMCVWYVGPMKHLAFGKGATEIHAYPAGTRLAIQAKVTDDKEGVVAFVSRHCDITHFFQMNSEEIEPLKKAMKEILKDVAMNDLEKSAAAPPVIPGFRGPAINPLTGKPFGGQKNE